MSITDAIVIIAALIYTGFVFYILNKWGNQMDTRNHEHYRDKTAHDAIKAADKPPDSVTRTINAMKAVAAIDEFEVFGRIKLRDKKTGKIYR